jgi:hypothetical protein
MIGDYLTGSIFHMLIIKIRIEQYLFSLLGFNGKAYEDQNDY